MRLTVFHINEKQTSKLLLIMMEKIKRCFTKAYTFVIIYCSTQNQINNNAIILLFLGLVYVAIKEPLIVGIILSISLFFYCLNRLISFTPYLNHFVRIKIRFWHIAGLIIALTATLTIFEMPAQAIFLSGLEQFLTDIAQQSSTGGTSSILIRNEQARLQELTNKGTRSTWQQILFCTWTADALGVIIMGRLDAPHLAQRVDAILLR